MPGALGHTVDSPVAVTVNGSSRYDLALLRGERWSSGGKPDTCTLESRAGQDIYQKFLDWSLHKETSNRQVVRVSVSGEYKTQGGEITAPGSRGGTRLIHVGVVVNVELTYDAQGPVYVVTSQLLPCHFGEPLSGYPAALGGNRHTDLANYDGELPALPEGGAREVIDRPAAPYCLIRQDLVFNPEVDGRIIANRVSGGAAGLYSLFLDYAQSRTPGNRRVHTEDDTKIVRWRLADAVLFLCGWLRTEEALVREPSRDALKVLGETEVENITVKIGDTLPEALDTLLEPYGYDWSVDLNNFRGPTIAVHRRGSGPVLDVHHQRPGEMLKVAANNAERIDLTYDVTKCVNAATIVGALRRYELTIELIPAWDAALEDALDGLNWALYVSKASPRWHDDPKLQDLFRLFVANEGGRCIGNTVWRAFAEAPSGFPFEIRDAFDLAGYLGVSDTVFSVRNRRFHPTITCNADLTPIGPHGGLLIEVSSDSGATWQPISMFSGIGGIEVLDDEMGIRFTGEWPPLAFIPAMKDGTFRIRVTGSIDSDDALAFGATGPGKTGSFGASVRADRQHEVIDASNKFFFRRVSERSQFHPRVVLGRAGLVGVQVVAAEGLPATEVDDGPKLVALWQSLAVWNQAECEGKIVLPTLSGPAELGMIVPKIGGLNLGLQTRIEGYRTTGAPSVIGIGYDEQGQENVIFLGSYRAKVSL